MWLAIRFLVRYLAIFDTVVQVTDYTQYEEVDSGDFAVVSRFKLLGKDGSESYAEPLTIFNPAGQKIDHIYTDDALGMRFEVIDFQMGDRKVKVEVSEHRANRRDFIVMQAIVFPYINILWIGCILLFIGSLMAVFHRIKLNRKSKNLA